MIWHGKKKAITFSFDDGVMQDIRTIEILDKYGILSGILIYQQIFACIY